MTTVRVALFCSVLHSDAEHVVTLELDFDEDACVVEGAAVVHVSRDERHEIPLEAAYRLVGSREALHHAAELAYVASFEPGHEERAASTMPQGAN